MKPIFKWEGVNMRKERLQQIVGYLTMKYDLTHHSCNHICFKIKPEDVIYIVNNYQDIINESNLYMSMWGNEYRTSWSSNTINFYVSATDYCFGINQKSKYETTNNFEYTIRFKSSLEIKIDISCGSILSFDFTDTDNVKTQISFRNDNK